MANQVELREHQLDLFDQLASAWRLPKLDCLDKGGFVLVSQNVGRFYFEDIVTESDQIRDRIILHVGSSLQKGLNFPFLVIAGVQLLILCPRRNNCHVAK